jgi:serine/threonine-protein kinase RsbW
MMSITIEMLTLPSNPANISKLESFVEQIAHHYNVTPDIYGNILISLTEAVTNAIKHGNQNDESKLVEVKLRKRQNKLAFSVSDEGKGFDFNNVPDPTAPENLLKIGGRGVFLMKQLSDMIVFRNQGSTVEMEFAL